MGVMRTLAAMCLVLLLGAVASIAYGVVAGRPLFIFAGAVWSLTAGDGLRRCAADAGTRRSASSEARARRSPPPR